MGTWPSRRLCARESQSVTRKPVHPFKANLPHQQRQQRQLATHSFRACCDDCFFTRRDGNCIDTFALQLYLSGKWELAVDEQHRAWACGAVSAQGARRACYLFLHPRMTLGSAARTARRAVCTELADTRFEFKEPGKQDKGAPSQKQHSYAWITT